jgi:hypothetical protein
MSEEYREDWAPSGVRDAFLFTASMLIVLQIFFIFYELSFAVYSTYFKPLEIVKESDFKEFDVKEDNTKSISDVTFDAIAE